MTYSPLQNRARLVCALLATTLLFPALAFADHDNGKGNKGRRTIKVTTTTKKTVGTSTFRWFRKQTQRGSWFLFGTILLFSSGRFLGANLAK